MIFLVTATLQNLAQGQAGPCLKSISFDAEKTVSYNISEGVDVNQLSDMDLMKIKPYQTDYHKSICVDANGHVSSEALYNAPALPDVGWNEPVYKITTNGGDVTLYSENESIIYTLSSQEQGLTSMPLLNAEETEAYGYENLIVIPTEEEAEILRDQGYQVAINGQTAIVSNGQHEYFLDAKNQIIEERTYEDQNLKYAELRRINPVNEAYGVLIFQESCRYQTISGGHTLEVCEFEVFSNYVINGQSIEIESLVDGSNKNFNFANDGQASINISSQEKLPYLEIGINPNPGQSTTEITLPNFFGNGRVQLEIIDLIGNQMMAPKSCPVGSKQKIDMTDWPCGIYIVRAGQGETWLQRKLIKN